MLECQPICALQSSREGFSDGRHEIDIFVPSTGIFNIVTFDHMKKMKNNSLAVNVALFDVDGLEGLDGKKIDNTMTGLSSPFVTVSSRLLQGKLLILDFTTGLSFLLKSCSFTSKILTESELFSCGGIVDVLVGKLARGSWKLSMCIQVVASRNAFCFVAPAWNDGLSSKCHKSQTAIWSKL